ncbi:ATP-binding cassette domain-containing protein [Kribbella sp. VKM Ac-2568]|uniref:ATP-binding cassette domain-containing protein n=1 Tax=Kribbella sp. VKM Ac-2568 TaxID=2512219 RepID=UPI001F546A38|nr:ATP-binding cassette domain-containing protein [Kribbella sp. VKM Ac-2568]
MSTQLSELARHRGAGRLGLFRRDQLQTRVGSLSTGQRRRLALGRLLTTPYDLMVLDEPTKPLVARAGGRTGSRARPLRRSPGGGQP